MGPAGGDDLFEVLERLGGLLRALAREAAARHGLQPVHVEILHYLMRCNRYSDTPGALVRYLGSTKGTVSQSLLLLERKGLVRRLPDASDRRRVRLRLTARARRLLAQLWPPAAWVEAVGALPAERRRVLAEEARELLRALQHANGSRSFGVCRSCRHHLRTADGARCALTGERLSAADAGRICADHEPAAA